MGFSGRTITVLDNNHDLKAFVDMVLLTMTPTIVEALETVQSSTRNTEKQILDTASMVDLESSNLQSPVAGQPISHSQIIALSKSLKSSGNSSYHLDILLRGARIYNPPPPPKSEPSPEYKALMARLRAEEESRAYERMINPPPPTESSYQRFPSSSGANAFSSTAAYISREDNDDEATFADVNRQMALVINVLVSIICCAAALWMVARWWSTPARLALSMGGSLVVAGAEVAIYLGYIRRLQIAKEKEGSVKEVKEIVKTWVVRMEDEKVDESVSLKRLRHSSSDSVRKRK